MSNITIQKTDIIKLKTDCIVNAANSGLRAGSGVCGAIFRAAGYEQLTQACDAIGGCPTGSAVITPGFATNAKYIVHAVGPIWNGGRDNEPQNLFSCYTKALELAMENNCHSIGFPLISAGIYGYPLDGAWEIAVTACDTFLKANADYELEIIFAVLSDRIYDSGMESLRRI